MSLSLVMSTHTNLKAGARDGFSLIEVLVVMGIISILLVAAIPLVSNTSNSARNASRETIKAHLQQARSRAISSGNATALVFPVLSSDPDLGARTMVLVEVENPAGRYVPIAAQQGKSLEKYRFGKLATGFYFLSNSQVSTAQPSVLESGYVLSLSSKGKVIECRAIIFAPSGQVVQPASGIHIAIAMGQAVNNKGKLYLTDSKEGSPVFDLLQINRLTGKVKFHKTE